MAPYRIVSMDGGGIRGILTARILERIDEKLPGFLSGVHLYAGTSTGGLLALGLGSGKSPKEMVGLYRNCAESVFADSLLDNLKDLGNLIGAEFSWEPLKMVLERYFKGLRLMQLPKKVLVSAFDLDNEGCGADGIRMWKMKFFHNFPSKAWDGKEFVVDIALRTSVAPSYFPVYQGYIDGGVAASSPAMCALSQALHTDTGGQKLEDIVLLSMGTGYNPHFLPVKDADWGLAQWAPHMLNIMLESGVGMVDYQCRQVLGNRYQRIDPPLPKPIGLGSIKYIPDLLEIADQIDIDAMLPWIQENFI
jgi:uncharacterized protein